MNDVIIIIFIIIAIVSNALNIFLTIKNKKLRKVIDFYEFVIVANSKEILANSLKIQEIIKNNGEKHE